MRRWIEIFDFRDYDKIKILPAEIKGPKAGVPEKVLVNFAKSKSDLEEEITKKIPGLNLSLYPSEIDNREGAIKLLNDAINLIEEKD